MTRRRTASRWVLLAVVVAAFVAFFALGLDRYFSLATLKHQQDQLQAWRAGHPLMAGGLFFALYVVVTALSLPGAAILTLAGGAVFGLVEGLVLVSFASSIGATLAMLASRFILREWVRRRFGERLRRIDDGMRREGSFYLFSLRLVPAFPFFVVNLVMGLTAIRVATYYWVSQLGMLAGTLVYVNAGTRLAQVDTLSGLLSPALVGSFLLLAALPWLSRALVAWIKTRRVYRGWRKPARFDRNLVVIGAGAAGLVSAYIGATLRARVTLVETGRMGGDCLNTGCVPSKALIRVARSAHEIRQAGRFGIQAGDPEVDFAKVMQAVKASIQSIEPHDSVERYEALGVDVRQGHARIVSPWCVEVDGEPVTTRAIVIAAGAEPRVPDLPGLADGAYLTSDTLWDLDALPPRLLVLGGGAVGCEMAQSFARLGSRVVQAELAERLLPGQDPEASERIAACLSREGVEVRVGHRALRVERDADGAHLVCEHAGREVRLAYDRLLVAVGRKPRTEGYGLDTLGLATRRDGTLETNARLQTRFPNILACGDIAGPFQLTHAGAHQAGYAAVNALFSPFKTFRADYRVMPSVTFTDPEVASVGLDEHAARARGLDVEVTRYDLADLDRALAEHDAEGFIKVVTPRGKDRILGAVAVGRHAGEWMAELVLAMRHGIGLNKILGTVHAYPTWAEANRQVAGAWKRAHAPQRVLGWLDRLHAWRRR